MGNKLDHYIGRNVRLKKSTFQKIAEGVNRRGNLENLFVVAAIAHGMNRLICYGANIRVAVSLSDVVMV